jgi:tetratricopeptide (TPR) repeat protein
VGGTKAFYAIGAMLPLCVFAAEGFDQLTRRHRTMMILLTALMGTWCVNSYMTYWIDGDDPDVLVHQARDPANKTQAADLIQKALAQDPKHVLARMIAGQHKMHAGQYRQAVDILEPLLQDHAQPSGASKWLAIMYQAARQTHIAHRYYQQAIARNPDDGAAHYLYAGLLIKTGQTDRAIEQYRQALHALFDDANIHADLTKAYAAAGKGEKAAHHNRIVQQITLARYKQKQDR